MIKEIIDKLALESRCTNEELLYLLNNISDDEKKYLFEKADEVRRKNYDNKVYIRGLIEFTNYCKRDCVYCGIRRSNEKASRYRLTEDEILSCVEVGDELGYKTFVLQGGEDPYFTDERLEKITREIKRKFPQNAITLSIGERSYESFKRLYDAGADRFLLRHETASKELYTKLHPGSSYENRMKCIKDLKEIGYQVGAGFMVGLPGQTNEDLVKDLVFLKSLQPHMVGIGPFIPHVDTPLGQFQGGTAEKTITMVALTRLLLPKALLPATTALGSIDKLGREKGIKAGANVVMPNLSPNCVREKYALYNGKLSSGDEAAECRRDIEEKIKAIGFEVEVGRGDSKV
ncbi:MAG: [FeFe] hydrogenase H-cluster radical SAM maturase HydE [Clostridium sp.]